MMLNVPRAFEVMGFVNPLGLFPNRIYPIFRQKSDRSSEPAAYSQILDVDGVISEFRLLHDLPKNGFYAIFSDRLTSWKGHLGIFGYASSEEAYCFQKGLDAFKAELEASILSSDLNTFDYNPTFGVEASRLIELHDMEALFASRVVRKMTFLSKLQAEGWVQNAPLSDHARGRARATFEGLSSLVNQLPLEEVSTVFAWQTERFSRYHDFVPADDHHLRTTKNLRHYFSDGLVVKNSRVFLHYRELADLKSFDATLAKKIGVEFVIAFDASEKPSEMYQKSHR